MNQIHLSMTDVIFKARNVVETIMLKMKNLILVTVDENAFVERHHPNEIYDFQLSMP